MKLIINSIGIVTKSTLPLIFFFSLILHFQVFANPTTTKTSVPFFSVELDLEYDQAMLKKNRYCTSQTCIEKFYTKLEETNYNLLLNKFLTYKDELKLNDWFFYNLVEKSVKEIYPKKNSIYRTLVTWFFMTKAGYDTRLYTAQNKYFFLFVRTNDEVYEMPFVKVDGDFFLDLTSIYYSAKTKGLLLEMQKFQPGALNERMFSLKISSYPNIPPMTVEKEFRFVHMEKEIKLEIQIDTLSNQLLSNYPFVKTLNYIHMPFRETTKKSLIKALKPHLKGLELEDQMSLLVSFTRKAFEYQNDQINMLRDMPLTAEEALLATETDFEDRVSIMYQLLKEITDFNFVVIQYVYDDIVTIGVELPEVYGKPFSYEGISYTICDPTMPANTGKLGVYPINLDKDFEILEEVQQTTEVGFLIDKE